MRACSAPGFIRARRRGACRASAARGLPPPSRKPCARRSAPAARACAILSEPTATRAISSSATGGTTARASPAGDAEARFAASRRGSGLLFSAPAVSASGSRLQPLLHPRIDELRHVSAKRRDLAHQRRRDEHVLLGGREENGLEGGTKAAVHPGELAFAFSVRAGDHTSQ